MDLESALNWLILWVAPASAASQRVIPPRTSLSVYLWNIKMNILWNLTSGPLTYDGCGDLLGHLNRFLLSQLKLKDHPFNAYTTQRGKLQFILDVQRLPYKITTIGSGLMYVQAAIYPTRYLASRDILHALHEAISYCESVGPGLPSRVAFLKYESGNVEFTLQVVHVIPQLTVPSILSRLKDIQNYIQQERAFSAIDFQVVFNQGRPNQVLCTFSIAEKFYPPDQQGAVQSNTANGSLEVI